MADLKTQVDRELGGALQNGAVRVAARQQARAATVPAALETGAASASSSLTYGLLGERNPEWLGDFWHQCRALYAGGPRLLRDEDAMKALFPAHIGEVAAIYDQRKARAFYIAYAGEIIDHLLAGFAADPIRLTAGVDEAKGGEEKPIAAWWTEFAADVSPPGAKRQKLSAFAVDCLREAFVTQSAWVLIDLPAQDADAAPPVNRLEEEQRGLLDPYLSHDARARTSWTGSATTRPASSSGCSATGGCASARPSPSRSTRSPSGGCSGTREGWEALRAQRGKRRTRRSPRRSVPLVDAKPFSLVRRRPVRADAAARRSLRDGQARVARARALQQAQRRWAGPSTSRCSRCSTSSLAPPAQGAFTTDREAASRPTRIAPRTRCAARGTRRVRGETGQRAVRRARYVAPFKEGT
jgi:hypothetical protein